MRTILSCVTALALIATGLLEHAVAVGPGGGMRGGATGPTAASPAAQWGPAPKPFSPAWYAQHPQAWHYTHPYAGAAVAVSTTAVARWLAVPVTGYGGSTSVPVMNESPQDYASEEVPGGKPAEPVGIEEPIHATTEPGAVDAGKWLNLGAFAINPPGRAQATHMVQLALAHDGTIRGSYYDVIGDHAQNIAGSVNKATLRAFWSVGSKSGIAFEVPVEELSRPTGTMTVHFPDGSTAGWKISLIP